MRLRDIIALVQEIYCGSVGSEYMHITNTQEKRWIQKRLEGYRAKPELDSADRRWLLTMLTAAEGIEKYLHTRYVGQKRFSLEGGEALIPLLDELIQRAGRKGVKEIVIGMAHRGRLNVLTNILGKPPQDIFDEFEGRAHLDWQKMAGDVKYHMGFSTDVDTPGGVVHLALGFNPSHLEIINPVIEGSVRARQHRRSDRTGDQVLPLLIHGDSAFAGQGVVMETLQPVPDPRLRHRRHGAHRRQQPDRLHHQQSAGHALHPLLHRRGKDGPGARSSTSTATIPRRSSSSRAWRWTSATQFHKDVIIDLVCYRRLGHNEADEPAVTQPMMYKKIRAPPDLAGRLRGPAGRRGRRHPEDDATAMVEDYRTSMEQGAVVARPVMCGLDNPYRVDWKSGRGRQLGRGYRYQRTAVTSLQQIGRKDAGAARRVRAPPACGQDLERAPQDGQRGPDGGLGLWREPGLCDPAGRRLSGPPVRSGLRTRHLLPPPRRPAQPGRRRELHAAAAPGESIRRDFIVIDSLLSEEAVLGFEYGYATAEPNTLTIWEAQFGDFANGAQVVIDQFISSAGTKWDLGCGLVMLLPHGYGGPGGGALLRPAGALPAAVRRAQHPGLRAHHPGADVSPAAPPDAAPLPQAADRDDAQEPAAPPPGHLQPGRVGGGRIPGRSSARWTTSTRKRSCAW